MKSPKFYRRTDADIKIAARAWANPATRAAAEITYGHISDWETSQVTNMEKLFSGATWDGGDANMQSFNDDISRWDTSNVTTMSHMFSDAHAFNGDLSTTLDSAARTMLRLGVRHCVVIDGSEVVGFISLRYVIGLVLGEDSQLPEAPGFGL